LPYQEIGKMDIVVKAFNELNIHELYDLMALRSEIFVVEQDCVYQDLDYIDQQCLHVLGLVERKLVAYTRIVPRGVSYDNYASIGRVVVHKKYRGQNLGEKIMERSNEVAIAEFKETIKISAQVYAIPFYEKLGYIPVGEEYLEDDIPHIAMILKVDE